MVLDLVNNGSGSEKLGSWSEWGRHILITLRELKESIEAIFEIISNVKVDLVKLGVHQQLWKRFLVMAP